MTRVECVSPSSSLGLYYEVLTHPLLDLLEFFRCVRDETLKKREIPNFFWFVVPDHCVLLLSSPRGKNTETPQEKWLI